MPGQNVSAAQGAEANTSVMTPGLSQLLGPLLAMFGESPEEQQQNLTALSEEMKGQSQVTKGKSMYSPELFLRFQQAMTPPQPRIDPMLAQRLLSSLRGL